MLLFPISACAAFHGASSRCESREEKTGCRRRLQPAPCRQAQEHGNGGARLYLSRRSFVVLEPLVQQHARFFVRLGAAPVNIPPLPTGWRRTCAGSDIGRARRVRRHFKDCRAPSGEYWCTASAQTRKPDGAVGAPPPTVSGFSGGVCVQPAVCVHRA
jgi:hypothetical protein